MTRAEALEFVKRLEFVTDFDDYLDDLCNEAIKIAIDALKEALEQEKSKDYDHSKTVWENIKAGNGISKGIPNQKTVPPMPNLKPSRTEPKSGKWIEHERAEESEGLLISNYECSSCHTWERNDSDYCPHCGARMESEE